MRPVVGDVSLVRITLKLALRVVPDRDADNHSLAMLASLVQKRLGLRLRHVLKHVTQDAKIVLAVELEFAGVANRHQVVLVEQVELLGVWTPDLDTVPESLGGT